MRILTTQFKAHPGEAHIFGFDVVKEGVEVRKRISYVSQETSAWLDISGLREPSDIGEYDGGNGRAHGVSKMPHGLFEARLKAVHLPGDAAEDDLHHGRRKDGDSCYYQEELKQNCPKRCGQAKEV
jgi:hypothetical protein